MSNTTLYPIALRQEDINLITFALRRLENNTSFPIIKDEAQNLISYIEYLNKYFKELE
jgi:hypothetical protein